MRRAKTPETEAAQAAHRMLEGHLHREGERHLESEARARELRNGGRVGCVLIVVSIVLVCAIAYSLT